METLTRRRILRRLIWVYTVCLCPTKRTLGLYGLNSIGTMLFVSYMSESNVCCMCDPHLLGPYKHNVPFCGTKTNSEYPDKTPQNAVSDQNHHGLLTAIQYEKYIVVNKYMIQIFTNKHKRLECPRLQTTKRKLYTLTDGHTYHILTFIYSL